MSSYWRPHFPTFYRYRVADPQPLATLWNRYPGHRAIGAVVVLGHRAYCVKWARLETRPRRGR